MRKWLILLCLAMVVSLFSFGLSQAANIQPSVSADSDSAVEIEKAPSEKVVVAEVAEAKTDIGIPFPIADKVCFQRHVDRSENYEQIFEFDIDHVPIGND